MVDALISPSPPAADAEVGLAAKVAFLSAPGALPGWRAAATRHETHMSWIFFAGEAVYKLKKPVRLPYLDFSTLAQRKAACEAEFRLNQRLAPGVYRAVVPLVRMVRGMRLGGAGEVVDWLVEMRRLDQRLTLEARLQNGGVARAEVDALAVRLAEFYVRAPRPHRSIAQQLASWRVSLALNRRVLLDPTLGMPGGAVRHVLAVQARFLRRRGDLIAARVRARQLVDAHGDLRPEHIWMGPPILIIDRLEFSAELRCIDWLDELSFLEIETQRLGAGEVGARIRRRICARLRDRPPEPLRLFYTSMRAMLRARLAMAHLMEPNPRTPEKWPRQALEYLAIATRHTEQLQRLLRTPEGR
jgi:aminoglycoside phosphotransferase family enzyme